MTTLKPKIVILCGPTASGKSALGIALALRFKAEIVNADSMQVYCGLDIGTAKPGPAERGLVKHHLLDLVAPDELFNAALYRKAAMPVIAEIGSRDNVPLLIGGTGLYIKTLLGGLMPCGSIDPDLRKTLQQECREQGPQILYERLKALDPQAALRIHCRDRIRIIRALEIIQSSGKLFSAQVAEHHFQENPYQALKVGLHLEREELYQRINQRCLYMIETGLLAETEALLKQGYDPDLKSLKSIGYRHMIQYLRGDCSWDRAIFDFQAATRRYAKRQITWFRADSEIIWFNPAQKDAISETIHDFLS